MAGVATLTINPAVDIAASVDRVEPFTKLRAVLDRRDPGGGGINVARVLKRFGIDVVAIYVAGGITGQQLQHLVRREALRSVVVEAREETRQDLSFFERTTQRHYRFVFAGSEVDLATGERCLSEIDALDPRPEYLVISGSLAPGLPDDFYAAAARRAKSIGAKVILDSSGPPLRRALAEGVHALKPSLRELRELSGLSLERDEEILAAVKAIIAQGSSEIVAVTLGEKGAILATRRGAWRGRGPEIKALSTIGAGDSFLAGLIVGLGRGDDAAMALRLAVASGSAAVQAAGTELCHPELAWPLVERISIEPV